MSTIEFDILISHAQILTLNEKMDSYQNGYILIKDSKISDLGSMEQYQTKYHDRIDFIESIDAKKSIVIPGFINSHSHFAMSLFRGLADDLSLHNWLTNYIWPLEAKLQSRHCYIGTKLAALEMIRGGTTSACDMYFFESDVLRALEEIGFRGVLGYGMLDFSNEEKRKKEVSETRELVKLCNDTAKICTPIISPHAPNTCSEDLLFQAKELSEEYHLPLQIHLAETKKEYDEIKKQTNLSPTSYLSHINFLCKQLVVAHSIWLDPQDYKLLKQNNVKVAHNPTSNLKLGSGILNYKRYKRNNILLALGTDSACSNNTLSMLGELRLASLLHKGKNINPELLPAKEALRMATINGAKALSMDKKVGSIEIGKFADLAILDINKPHLWPPHDPYSLLTYAAIDSDIDTTIINGKIVMKNRQMLTIDIPSVMDEAKETIIQLLDEAKLEQFKSKMKYLH